MALRASGGGGRCQRAETDSCSFPLSLPEGKGSHNNGPECAADEILRSTGSDVSRERERRRARDVSYYSGVGGGGGRISHRDEVEPRGPEIIQLHAHSPA
ncbi:hypothetical protein AAFF_G00310850 [Aldrovandia affinis]|uniref:Uncharacterized protein n=1 Tax=Aldrovandia affinis TaxID=143900 RepID=A0AAD7W0J7_9TELE|nr:hypothetical protein AAFF_G00310850 [Aldrovandia affinis]